MSTSPVGGRQDPRGLSDATRRQLQQQAALGYVSLQEMVLAARRNTLRLMGVTSLAQLNGGWVRPARPVGHGRITGAYPWFEEQAGC